MSSALTAVIITGNEERNIKRCIDSLLPVVDEVVVLDSFSTDQTPKFCQEYTEVRFVQHEWLGYAQAKNLANSMATNDWVISIDADECLSVELHFLEFTL
jgi:glycosyltransferase involved in cell wall biosynthesis